MIPLQNLAAQIYFFKLSDIKPYSTSIYVLTMQSYLFAKESN